MSDARTGSSGIVVLDQIKKWVDDSVNQWRDSGKDARDFISIPDQPQQPAQQQQQPAGNQTYQATNQTYYQDSASDQKKPAVKKEEKPPSISGSSAVMNRMQQASARMKEKKNEEKQKEEEERRRIESWNDSGVEKWKNEEVLRQWSETMPKALPAGTADKSKDVFEGLSEETKDAMRTLGIDPEGFAKQQAAKQKEANQLAEKDREVELNRIDEHNQKVQRGWEAQADEVERITGKRPDYLGWKEETAPEEKPKAKSKKKKGRGKKSAKVEAPADLTGVTVADPNGNIHQMGDVWEILPGLENTGAKSRKLLPGGFDPKFFKVPEWLLKKSKMSEDKKIEKAMEIQSQQLMSTLFADRADVMADLNATGEINYGKDWDEGKREYGRYDTGLTDRQQKQLEAIQDQLDWIGFCYVPTEGQHIDEDGNIKCSDHVERAIASYMNHMGLAPHEKWLVFHQVAKRLGYSPDSNGKFLLQDSNKIPDELFIQALRDLERATVIHKNPYHMFGRAPKYGGTKCFPIGVMTKREAEILCRDTGPLKGMAPFDAMSKARNEFVNVTLHEIRRAAHLSDNGSAQLRVLNNYVRALCSLDAISPRYFNVAEALDRGYDELRDECDPTLNPHADPAVQEMRIARANREERRRNKRRYKLDRVRNRTKSVYSEDVVDEATGEVIHRKGERVNPETYIRNEELRSSKMNPFDAFCTFSTNMAKFMGVFGFTPVIVGGYVEHFAGNINVSISNRIIGAALSAYGSNGATFKPTEAMYAYITTDEGLDAVKALKALMRVGGMDAVALFREEYAVLNTENAKKFLNDCVNKESLFNGRFARTVKKITANINDGLQILLPGDLGFAKADAKRWLEGFMLNNQINANSGDVNERSFTASEVTEMMQSMGVGAFMSAAAETYAGRDAAVMMRNSTLARESPVTHIADVILKRSGLANVVITLGIDTYFVYGLNLIQAMIPFSNTASYLAVRGINMVATGGVNNLDENNLNILEYQMGGLDSFGQGLVKNLLYDFVKIANVGIFACLTAAILIMIGFDEPEDPGLKYRWDEYKIGRKIGLGGFDENGNPQGIPIYRAWWMDDLTLFGLPLAYAISASTIEQKKNDPELPVKMFRDGFYDVISGASALDLIRSIKNAEQVITEYDALMSDPNKKLKTDWFSYAYMQFFELPVARAANKMFVPNALRDMMRDEYEHTPYKVYNRDSKTPGATESVDDWTELQRRIESRYNPIYALCNNWFRNGYLFDKGDTQKTGYLYQEMPLATEPDARKTSFLETKLNYTPLDKIAPDEMSEYVDQKCEQLIDMIENEYEWNVDKAVADGFTIPFDLRFEFASYIQRRWNFANNVYNEAVANGVRGVEKNEMWTAKENDIFKYKNLLNDWIYNTAEIPWTDVGYVKLRTDYETVYSRKSTGEPVAETDYIFEGPGDIEKHYVPRGNHPNNLALFTTPETQNRGYNYETIASWYDPKYSDLDKIFKEQEGIDPNLPANEQPGKVAKYGYNRDVPLNSAMFGGNLSFPTNQVMESSEYGALQEPTAGRRALVPFEEKMLWDLPNFNGKLEGGNGSGSGSDSSGSGSGSDGKMVNANIPENSVQQQLKSITRENVDPGNLGEMGKYYDPDYWKSNSSNTFNYGSRGGGGYSRRSYGGGGGSNKNPKIYNSRVYSSHVTGTHVGSTNTGSTSRSINPDRASTMYSKQPQSTKINTYLRPSFSTKGSREAYKRQDI